MQYLLDANVLITANATYYEKGRVPHFWDWLASESAKGIVKIPQQIFEEITPSSEDWDFADWISKNEGNLSLAEIVSEQHLIRVLQEGYELEPSTIAESLPVSDKNDVMLISYALAGNGDRCVVTLESKQENAPPTLKPNRRKIPYVCRRLGIRPIDTFDLIRELDFRIPS